MTDGPVKRRYDSSTRRAAASETRTRICVAAEELFLRDGYVRTSIEAVAMTAGVAEATVYLAFGDKPGLLDAVILRAVRDSASESIDAILAAPADEIIGRLSSSNASLMARAARLIALGEGATLMDADLRPQREQAHRGLRAAFRQVAERLEEAGLLRTSASEAADTIYAIANETTFLRVTAGCVIAPDAYARWLTGVLSAALLSGGSTS